MSSPAKRRIGRPENPELRDNVLRAAIDCYAEKGWSGFNFDIVATRAGVGRPALYRRWADRTALLVDAFKQLTPGLVDEDLGSLRDELVRLGADYSTMMHGPRGLAGTRLMADAHFHPDLFARVSAEVGERREDLVRRSVERACSRGELAADCARDISLLLFGALWERSVLAATGRAPHPERPDIEHLVSVILRGVAQP
ncbi:TetR/AcrR family transcriptional regulator [Streptomyces sp. NBC_01314]|uniref:TetR/AcrR family transcriptional regulator n=1 Tax=Streptomyces sp. NBC_01314 TaxID=2903821 RepID=UPI00308921ED|nr:TetR/AcrR family transcriptional regulator [Streptomyces sp. NBC_01314]